MADEAAARAQQQVRVAIATHQKYHDQFKWAIEQYIDQEDKKTFELWRECQERHFKLSLELQIEQVSFKLARAMLEDNLVGTESAVSLLIKNMFNTAQEKAKEESMDSETSPCCTVDDADVDLKINYPPYDPADMYPEVEDKATLDRINDKLKKHIKRDVQRKEALMRNARARKQWCKDISAQLRDMEKQVQFMRGARGHWVDLLKPKLPGAQRQRFKVLFDDVERQARKMVRGMKTKREADKNGAVAPPPDGAITWTDHWAQAGMRANGAALRQSDYRMTSLEELYSSEGEQRPDDPNAPQPPVARRRPTRPKPPPRRATTIVEQVILDQQIEEAVVVAKKKLFNHAAERFDQLKHYLDHPQYSLQASKRLIVDVLVESSKELPAKPLGLGTYDVVYLWYKWGEMEDPPLPKEKVQEIIDAYSDYLIDLFAKLDDWMRDHCEKSGVSPRKQVKPYNNVTQLNYNYSYLWKYHVFVWGGTAKEYKGQDKTAIKSRPDLKKFYKGSDYVEPWQYREARTFGIISKPTYGLEGLALNESIAMEVFTPEERAQRKAREDEERRLALAWAARQEGLNEDFQASKRAREEAEKLETRRLEQLAQTMKETREAEEKEAKTQWLVNREGSQEREDAAAKLMKMENGPLWLKEQERREEREAEEAKEAEVLAGTWAQDSDMFDFEADMRAAEEESSAEAVAAAAPAAAEEESESDSKEERADDEEMGADDEEERRARIADLRREYDKLRDEMGVLYTEWANAGDNITSGPALEELDPSSGSSHEAAMAAFEAGNEAQIREALAQMREVYDRLSAALEDQGVSAGELFDEDDDSTGGGL